MNYIFKEYKQLIRNSILNKNIIVKKKVYSIFILPKYLEHTNNSIIFNNELFKFAQPLLYWILLYKSINNNNKIYRLCKNVVIPKLVKYYSDIFNIDIDLTFQNPEYEYAINKPFIKSKYLKNIIKNPCNIKKGTYDFLVLEFYKREISNKIERNSYHIFITMLYTFYYIVSSINKNANCLIITRIIGGFYPLIILELFFKCFEKVEFVEVSKLNLYPLYAFDFPIKLYGFKKEKTEWFLKKCEALMKKIPLNIQDVLKTILSLNIARL